MTADMEGREGERSLASFDRPNLQNMTRHLST